MTSTRPPWRRPTSRTSPWCCWWGSTAPARPPSSGRRPPPPPPVFAPFLLLRPPPQPRPAPLGERRPAPRPPRRPLPDPPSPHARGLSAARQKTCYALAARPRSGERPSRWKAANGSAAGGGRAGGGLLPAGRGRREAAGVLPEERGLSRSPPGCVEGGCRSRVGYMVCGSPASFPFENIISISRSAEKV